MARPPLLTDTNIFATFAFRIATTNLMSVTTTLIMAIALAMDCFAVSIAIGLNRTVPLRVNAVRIPLAFGIFQGLMPLIGWFLSAWAGKIIESVDHYIAFGMLAFIGGKMLWESLHSSDDNAGTDVSSLRMVLWLAIATSIDALAVGVTYGVMSVPIYMPAAVIGAVAAAFATAGLAIGKSFGNIFGNKAEIFGGSLLILLGAKILAEHLNII